VTDLTRSALDPPAKISRAPTHSVVSSTVLASVCDAVPSIVFVVDAATAGVEHVSDRFAEYAGRSVDEAHGNGWRSVVHPEDLSRATLEVRGPIERGELFRTDVRLLDRHGIYRWHEVRASPLKRADGIVERWLGTCTDVDDQRRSERESAISRSVLTALSSARAPDEILGRFVEAVTAELADFCAVDLDEAGRARPRRAALAIASSFAALATGLDAAPSQADRDAIARATTSPREKPSAELAGALAPLAPRSLLVLPLIIGGEASGHVWLASLGRARAFDERDRRNAEELVSRLGLALHHARAIEEGARGLRLRDEFLSVVSHELRTPLSTVLGWSRLLREDSSDPARLRRGLAVIERSAGAQSRIIDGLLDASRAVSGKLRIDPHDVSIAAIARDAVEAIRPVLKEKRIAIALVHEHEARATVDPERIRQLIDHLLSNAAKFTPIGGSVSLAVRSAANVGSSAEQIELEVTDSGVGIDPSFLPLVFDRFSQGDSTTTRRHGGLGIGLAIVRAIAELHGGSVRARSDGLGAGATFTVHLPLRPLASSERVTMSMRRLPVQTNELSGVRILVVDDEADARELSSTILSFHGAHVVTADSAKEAMRMLDASPFDVLLSDIGMPDEDGVSLVKRARAAFPHLPAIALSAYTRVEDEERAIEAGFARYLTKPVDPESLVSAIALLARAARA
jgi:PAS domain S-box-containing protein